MVRGNEKEHSFEYEQREAVKIAMQLGYPEVVRERIMKAKTSNDINRILIDARNGIILGPVYSR